MNWKQMLEDLHSKGFNDTAIGKIANCAQSTIWRLRMGISGEPLWYIGDKIIALHKANCLEKAA